MCHGDRDRDECYSDGLWGLHRAIESFDPARGPFGPWACHWIWKAIATGQRARARKARMVRTISKEELVPKQSASAEHGGLDHGELSWLDRGELRESAQHFDPARSLELRDTVKVLMAMATPNQRRILRAVYLRGKTRAEVAAASGISVDRVKDIICEARARILADPRRHRDALRGR